MEKLDKKATGEMNEIYERFVFNSRNLLMPVCGQLRIKSGSDVLLRISATREDRAGVLDQYFG